MYLFPIRVQTCFDVIRMSSSDRMVNVIRWHSDNLETCLRLKKNVFLKCFSNLSLIRKCGKFMKIAITYSVHLQRVKLYLSIV